MADTDRFTCEEVFRRLDDYLDRELAPAELQKVREHLDECAVCAAEHRFERRVLDDIKEKVRRIAAPADLVRRVQLALAQARSAPKHEGGIDPA